MTALLIDIIVKATAVIVAAALLDAALSRRASAAVRHFVWSVALIALLALPAAIIALPRWQVQLPVSPSVVVAVANSVSTMQTRAASEIATTSPVAPPRDIAATFAPTRTTTKVRPGGFAAFYFAGVLILLIRFALESLTLRRLTRTAVAVTDATWVARLDECARRMRLVRPVRLLCVTSDVMPFTFGTLHPTIVVPASASTWSDDRCRTVLLHELAHVARHDCLVQRLAAIATAVYWPHPGIWFGARRLRIEREMACDDCVLEAGAGADDYAAHLLELAHSLRPTLAPSTALGIARTRHLERRLLAVLDVARSRRHLHGPVVVAGAALAAAFVLMVGPLRAAIVPGGSLQVTRAPAGPATSPQDLTGTWDLRRTTDPAVVQISVRTAHGNNGRTVRLDQLTGLPIDQISGSNATVHFPIRRDAGTFTVDGVCRTGVCGGTFVFEPDAQFANTLAMRGVGRPMPQDQLALAIANVGVAYLDALAAAGYSKPDIQLVVRAAQHGVDLGYMRAMTDLGYRVGTLDRLIVLRDHGVDSEYVRGMAADGIHGLSADDLVRARDHGVDPAYIRGMSANGITGLSLDDLVRTRDHGVDPTYIRGMATLGYSKLSVDALVRLRDHGVDPSYVGQMAELGYKGLSPEDLVRMRDHGVDPEYVRRLQRGGATGLGVDEIIRRRDHGES